MSFTLPRRLGGAVTMLVGGLGMAAMLVVMNHKVEKPEETKARSVTAVKVEEKKRPPKAQPVQQPKPKPQTVRRTNAPRPQLASNLAGLGVGLPMFQAGDVSSLGDDLLSGHSFSKDMVLNEEAVDQPPTASPGNAQPAYPPRARAKGVEGFVVVRLVIGQDGSVRKVNVVESAPEGVFEDSVLEAARNWSFTPATYQGQPAQVTTTQRLVFKLG